MSQIVPYLWHENLNLEKETYLWVEKETYTIILKEGGKAEIPLAKVKISEKEDGKREITIYDEKGEIEGVSFEYMEDEFTEICEMQGGDKEIKKYDEKGRRISEVWIYPDGEIDEKIFEYEEDKLVKIIEKDEFDVAIEELKYVDDKLSQIISLDESGEVLMVREILYDDEGKIQETHRIQDEEINMKVFYFYDAEDRLIKKEEEKINRLTEEMMAPETFEYTYHDNGLVKEEKWIIYLDDQKKDIKLESISVYDELGLEIESMDVDYLKDKAEMTVNKYEMKE